MDVALQSSVQLDWRTSNTARLMFLVGDAPSHREGAVTAVTTMNQLRQKGRQVFPVGASGVEKTAEVLMRTASILTKGLYLFLTNHSGVGNAHATPSVSSFAVERLDRLMIRIIASELAGKRLIPHEVIAIERGDRIPGHHQFPAYSQPVNHTECRSSVVRLMSCQNNQSGSGCLAGFGTTPWRQFYALMPSVFETARKSEGR